jgi:putative endopeptidase
MIAGFSHFPPVPAACASLTWRARAKDSPSNAHPGIAVTASLLRHLGLALLLVTGACAAPDAPPVPVADIAAEAPAMARLPRPRAGDDFYGHVNSDWLATYRLPPDKASSGAAEELAEKAEHDVHAMIEAIVAARPAPGTVEQKIADLYAAAMDEAAIEARGIAPIQPFLDRIHAVKDTGDLTRLMGVIGFNSPIGAGVGPSPADPDANAVWVSQAGLGMPHRGYYLDFGVPSLAMQVAYRKHIATMLRLTGHADPEEAAKRIYALEYRIAQVHTDEDRSISAQETMRAMSYESLRDFAPTFDWDLFLGAAGFTGQDRFVVTDHTAVADLAGLVDEIPLQDWKDWLHFHIASDFAPYLPKAFADSAFSFFSGQISGVTEKPERWKFAVAVVNERLGEAVAQIYVKRYFPPANKAKIDAIVGNIRKAFEMRMRSLDWMDDETRAAALEKLAALQGMIGHPDQWRDYSTYPVQPGKLLEAIYAGYEYDWRGQQADLHSPVDRLRWLTPAHVVNAFYNPLGNTFVLPAGILQPPFFDPAADPAENYGGIGAVVGHEMSHGFDDQGRQFDAQGYTRNWWTEETDDRFMAKSFSLIRQYDAYCPFFGACVNGLGTLGENIGDLAGLEIAYAAWKLSLDGREPPVIDGVTGDQRFFIAYARTYRDMVREEFARALLDGDSHAPSRYRVNGVVRNMDAWYQAFDIQPDDRLYLPPAERVSIW